MNKKALSESDIHDDLIRLVMEMAGSDGMAQIDHGYLSRCRSTVR